MTILRGGYRCRPSRSKLVGYCPTSVDTTSDAVSGPGRVVFFAVPGAFTPTCDTVALAGASSPMSAKFRCAGR